MPNGTIILPPLKQKNLSNIISIVSQTVRRPVGQATTYHLTYEECRKVIESMRFAKDSALFGNGKDDSFRGSLGNNYQSFEGQEIYPTLEEKAAKSALFRDQKRQFLRWQQTHCRRIFLCFLDKKHALFTKGGPDASLPYYHDRRVTSQTKRN